MPGPIRPGTIVRINTSELRVPRGSPAILLRHNIGVVENMETVDLLGHFGPAGFSRHEIVVPRNPLETFAPMRLRLPYGCWTEADGSKVLFSRDYLPLWRISSTGEVSQEDPWRRIYVIHEEFFWDARAPWIDRRTEQEMEGRLASFGISGGPRLLGAVEFLVSGEAYTIKEAVRLMMPPHISPHGYL